MTWPVSCFIDDTISFGMRCQGQNLFSGGWLVGQQQEAGEEMNVRGLPIHLPNQNHSSST